MVKTKKEALSIILTAASSYRKNLFGKTFLFVCQNRNDQSLYYFEANFDSVHFKHLTGVKTQIPSAQFWDFCINKRLAEDDFDFADDGTTELKLDILPLVFDKIAMNMIGDYSGNKIKLFTEKVAGNVFASIGFKKTKSGKYVPNTLLREDIRNITRRTDRILMIYKKDHGMGRYEDMVYYTKKFDWEKITLTSPYEYLPKPV